MPLTHNDLAQFTGSEHLHVYSFLFRNMLLTNGTKYLAEQAGAYWLMDAIASHQPKALRNDRLRDFQLWRLDVNKNKATLSCFADSNEEHLIRQRISYTDFPLDSIELYCVPVDEKRRVIMLKNEY